MSLQRTLIAIAFAYFALTPAFKVGSVWQLKAHPIPNVQVILKGQRHSGTLTRDWWDDWVLIDGDGGELRFHDYEAMTFHPPTTTPPAWQGWRSLVPLYAVGLAAVAIAFGRVRTKPKARVEDSGEDPESRLLREQAERYFNSPWSPTQRLLKAAYLVGSCAWLFDVFVLTTPGQPPSLPFWARALAWSVSAASITAFVFSLWRPDPDDDEHVPEPLRSHLRQMREEAKSRRER